MKKDEEEEEEKEGMDEEEDEEKRVSEVHVRRGRRQSGKQGDVVRKALAIVLHFTTKSLFRYGRCSIQVGKSPLLFLPRAPLSGKKQKDLGHTHFYDYHITKKSADKYMHGNPACMNTV